MLNCYIYGAGRLYNRIIGLIRNNDKICIKSIIVTNSPKHLFIDGFEVHRFDDIELHEDEYIIIAVEEWKEIYFNLTKAGIQPEKIILGKVFELPYFHLEKYLKLKHEKPSIISNTCLGGRIYKELGLKMLSPCINTICFNDNDYISFIQEIRKYSDIDIDKYTLDSPDKYNNTYKREWFIPKGVVGGEIIWNFPHEDCEIAISNWNRRRNRINYENLSYVMIAFSDDGAKQFDKFEATRKIGFYYRDLGLKNIVYTPEWNDINVQRKYDYNYVMFIHRYATNVEGQGRIDWISFLSSNSNFCRW